MSNLDSILKNKYGFENPFKPDPLAEKALPYLNNGNYLLDVGCGEGADTVFFAKRGFQVTALDNNEKHLDRLQAFINDNSLTNASVVNTNVLNFQYPQNYYDVISCILVGCCMSRSDFGKLLVILKLTVKKGGIIIISLRNYLDPQFKDSVSTETMIEPNTFNKGEGCCEIRYYIEKNRLRECSLILKFFIIMKVLRRISTKKFNSMEIHILFVRKRTKAN